MDAGIMVAGAAVFALFGFVLVGGPMILADWSRTRRQAATERQIALTDALDEQLGPIVSPVVTRPLFDPWQILLDVPLSRLATVGRIVVIVNEVVAGFEATREMPYHIILRVPKDSQQPAFVRPARSLVERWTTSAV